MPRGTGSLYEVGWLKGRRDEGMGAVYFSADVLYGFIRLVSTLVYRVLDRLVFEDVMC